ncbi:helix-turn-helix domain-containing protein [Streptomyces sp. NPDC050842]|uniref:AraC-like ligand-binding domain-containing protein n=1 Tax=Streptomyces sp. NPDC050842 TaxID=3365636 RepID=UPI00379D2807
MSTRTDRSNMGEHMDVVFDSDVLPAAARASGWQELADNALCVTQVRYPDEGSLKVRLKAVALREGVQLAALTYGSLACRRTPALIRRSDPELYQLALITGGRQNLEQCGRRVSLGRGELVLYDSSRPYEASVTADGGLADSLILNVPKHLLPFRDAHVSRLLAVPLSARQGVGGLLARFLTGLGEELPHCTPQDTGRLQSAVLDLAGAVLAHHLDRERSLPSHSQQHVLFLRIESFIRAHLGSEDLTPAVVASAHQMSVRALHRLFGHHHTTVAAFIRRQRLEHCRRDLTALHLSHLTVHAIGTRWGFPRPAVFSRVFRSAYGLPPGEYRHRALLGAGTRR